MNSEWFHEVLTRKPDTYEKVSDSTCIERRDVKEVVVSDISSNITYTEYHATSRLLPIGSYLDDKIDKMSPTKYVKTGYIEDTEVIFKDIPDGNVSVFAVDTDGKYPSFTYERVGNDIYVYFDALLNVTTVTLSII